MIGRDGRRSPVAALAMGLVLLLGGAGWLTWVWMREGATTADPQASVLGVVLAAAGSAIALTGWALRRRQMSDLPATADQVDQAAATLAGLAREQWIAEAKVRGLIDLQPMPVRWHLTTPALMDQPSVISPETPLIFEENSARIGPLVAAFHALPRRRLVILGPPGAGKTTLAVQLLLELLAHRQPAEPVPVLFSLLSWSPDAQPRLQDWLTTQVELTYPALRAIGADTPAALVEQDRILPILDGLDEVDPSRQAKIIAALNESLTGGVVLTSRRAEYRTALNDAGDVLTAAASISPLALTATEAATYLTNSLPPARPSAWDDVLTELATGAATNLAAVTATPLGLWLVRSVYFDRKLDPTPLIDGTFPVRAALKSHLLDELIPTVVSSRSPHRRRRRKATDAPMRPSRRREPDDLRRNLTIIAEQLRSAETREWLWWQLAEHTFAARHAERTVRRFTGLAAGLMAGLMVGLVFGLKFELVAGLIAGVVCGVLAGLFAAVVVDPGAPPEHMSLRLSGRIRQLLDGLVRQPQAVMFKALSLVVAAFGAGLVESAPV